MAATPLEIQEISSRYPAAMDAYEFVAANAVDGNTYKATGRELVLIRNTDDSDHDVTVVSVPNRNGRTGNLVETVTAGEDRIIYLGVDGWRSRTTGLVTITSATDDIELAVIRLPA